MSTPLSIDAALSAHRAEPPAHYAARVCPRCGYVYGPSPCEACPNCPVLLPPSVEDVLYSDPTLPAGALGERGGALLDVNGNCVGSFTLKTPRGVR